MSNDPSKRLPLSQQLSGLFRGFSSKLLQKKTIPTKVTVCDLGRMQTVLLELEKGPDHLFVHRIDIIKNAPKDQKPSLVLKPFFS